MKNLALLISLFLVTVQLPAQDSIAWHTPRKHQLVLHYYPSALVVGDISLGLEQVFKNNLGHELSFNIKTLPTKFYDYDKGFRFDYLLKWALYRSSRFRFSYNLSSTYNDIHFTNKEISYFYQSDHPQKEPLLYQKIREDRRHTEYGCGLGFSINFKIYRNLFVGGDMAFNFIKYKTSYNYKEITYPFYRNQDILVPVTDTKENSRPVLSPMARLKFSYLLWTKKPKGPQK